MGFGVKDREKKTNEKRYGELYKCRDFRYKRQKVGREEKRTRERREGDAGTKNPKKTHLRRKKMQRTKSLSHSRKKAKQKKKQSFEEPSLICLLLEKRGALKKHIETTFGKLNK